MSEICERLKTSAELEEELEALKIRIALARLREEELREIEAECENPDPELVAAVEEADDRILERIDRSMKRAKRERIMRRSARWGGRAAAFILIICAMLAASTYGLALAAASSPTIRTTLDELFMKVENDYTLVRLQDSGVTFEVPEEWEGYYYPTYIPEGYGLEGIRTDSHEAVYVNAEGNKIFFYECPSNTVVYLDTEDAAESYITKINGNNAIVTEKNGRIIITWITGNRYFCVATHENQEVTTEIAKSVLMIR